MTATDTRTRSAVPAARRVPHPLLTESRRSLAPWAGLAAFVLTAAVMAAKSAWWQGSWELTLTLLRSVGPLLCGPLAAAAGCRQGGRERRDRLEDLGLTASRGEPTRFLVAVLPVAAAVVAGYLLAAAGCLLACLPYVSGGRLQLAQLLPQAVLLAALTAGGAVVGRLVRWRPAAPALAVCVYLALAAPVAFRSALSYLSPAAGGGLGVWWQPLAMAGWLAALAAAAVLGYAGGRRRYLAFLPLAAALAAAVPLTYVQGGMFRPDPLGVKPVCAQDGAAQVCVDALDAGTLPQVVRAVSGIAGRLRGVPHAPVRFEVLHRPPRADEVELPALFLGQSVVRGRLTDPARYAWETGAQLVGRDCDDHGGDDPVTESAVLDWLVHNRLAERRMAVEGTVRPEAYAAEKRALGRLESMPDAGRRAWLGRYLAVRHDCGTKEPTL